MCVLYPLPLKKYSFCASTWVGEPILQCTLGSQSTKGMWPYCGAPNPTNKLVVELDRVLSHPIGKLPITKIVISTFEMDFEMHSQKRSN